MSHRTKASRSAAGAAVVITGAARGMGELYARRAAHEGAQTLVLIDIDAERLEALAVELRHSVPFVRVYSADLGDREAVTTLCTQILAEAGVPDLLINNAGVVRGGSFAEQDPEHDIEFTIRVNTLAPMWLTRGLLPAMMADTKRHKRILNVASAAGTLANPNMSVYAASKWAMIGWSDSLRLELARSPAKQIDITTFCPSYVSTGMFAGARGPLLTPILKPEQAVELAWSGMLAGVPFVFTPWTVKLSMALRGVLPTRVWDFIADKVFHVYSSMDQFTGRSAQS